MKESRKERKINFDEEIRTSIKRKTKKQSKKDQMTDEQRKESYKDSKIFFEITDRKIKSQPVTQKK